MKKFLFLVFCAVVPLGTLAQNTRLVRGVVLDEDGNPKSGVRVVEVSGTTASTTEQNGTFTIMVSPYSRYLEVVEDGYMPCRVEIDASYMVFRLRAQGKRAVKPQNPETAPKVQKPVSNQMSANEREKRQEVFLDSLQRRQKQMMAELEEMKAAKALLAEKLAREKKRAARVEVDKKYNKKYRNKGLIHTFELSYTHQLASADLVYKNLGYRKYGSLEPLGLIYMLGYRVSNWVSFSIGTGLTYDLNNLCLAGDVFDERYPEPQAYNPFNVPIFADMNVYMSRGKVQPFLSVSGGVYAPRWQGLLDFGIGVNFRLNKRMNLYLHASVARAPYVSFVEPDTYWSGASLGYKVAPEGVWAPSFKLGFSL